MWISPKHLIEIPSPPISQISSLWYSWRFTRLDKELYLESRHTVVCRAAQEAGVPPVSILTGRKKTQFSHLCSSEIPYPIRTKFAADVPAS